MVFLHRFGECAEWQNEVFTWIYGHLIAIESELLFKSWLPMVIHSLAKTKGFTPDPQWIKEKLRDKTIPEQAIEDVLNELIKSQSIVEENGGWKPGQFVHRHPDDFNNDQFKIYKVGQLKAAAVADQVNNYNPSHSHMLSICVPFEKENEILNMFSRFRDQLIEISKSCEQGDTVMFISNNVFTMADDVP